MHKKCKCAYCGSPFIPKNSKQKYCSIKCRDENRNKRVRENPEKYTYKYSKKKKKPRKSRMDALGQINSAARAEELTYGQYVARHGIN